MGAAPLGARQDEGWGAIAFLPEEAVVYPAREQAPEIPLTTCRQGVQHLRGGADLHVHGEQPALDQRVDALLFGTWLVAENQGQRDQRSPHWTANQIGG